MVRDILKKAGYKVGLLGTIDYEWGDGQVAAEMTTPEAMDIQKYLRQMVDEGCQYAVMEASSQGLKLHRLDGIQFDVGIFTNLGNDHISSMEHAGMEEYAACKAELFRRCRIGIGNLDDRWYERIVGQGSCEKLTFSCLQESDYQASWVTLLNKNGRLGTLFMVGNEEYQVSVPGVFSVYNALAAIAVCSYYGVPTHTINEALSEVNVSGRVEAVETSQRYRILIDYAHNALSLKNILTTMRRYHPYRLMVLFGCCGNLAVSKRREMGVTAGRYADFTVITSDNPRNENPETIMAEIEEGIRETGAEYVKIADRKEAIRYILEKAKTGDIVILAGKGHERYQEIGGEKVPFDERQIVREILGE